MDTARTLLLKDPLHQMPGPSRALLRMPSSPNGTARPRSSHPFMAKRALRRLTATGPISPRSSGRTLLRLDVPFKLAQPPTQSSQACTSGTPSATTTLKVNCPPSTINHPLTRFPGNILGEFAENVAAS